MPKRLHQYFNLKEPATCKICGTEITDINRCKVLINPEAIKEKPYDVDINESDVEYICTDCYDKF